MTGVRRDSRVAMLAVFAKRLGARVSVVALRAEAVHAFVEQAWVFVVCAPVTRVQKSA